MMPKISISIPTLPTKALKVIIISEGMHFSMINFKKHKIVGEIANRSFYQCTNTLLSDSQHCLLL